jgi:hypothetical protein
MFESLAIGAEGAVVVDAAGHVGPVSRANLVVRRFLEIEDVEGLSRVRNNRSGFLGFLRGDGVIEERSDAAECRDIGAGRQKFQELAAGFKTGAFHNGCQS